MSQLKAFFSNTSKGLIYTSSSNNNFPIKYYENWKVNNQQKDSL